MNELILSQLNNQAPNANRAVGSIKTVEKSASRTIVSLDGNSLPILSGAYTGEESAVFDVEIDSLTVTTPIVSAVIEKISGDGTIESVSADTGATAETITITLNNLGTDERAASVSIYNRIIQAQITGTGGNSLSIAVDESGLVFSPSTYTLLKSLSAGAEKLTGIEYNFGGLSLDSRGQIQSGTQRFRFRGYPGIYRQYREFNNGEHVYVFTPKIAYAIPEGTPVDVVTGDRVVTVLDSGVVQETFPGIVTVFDFLNAMDTASALVEVAGAVVEDKLPGGDSVIDLDLVTHSIALPVTATGSTYAKTLDDITVAIDAPTQIIEIECTDNGDMGDEVWKVTGNLSGALGDAISGTPFTSAVCGFTVPEKIVPTTDTVSGTYIPTSRDADEAIPSVCVNYVTALKNAKNGTYTFVYTERSTGGCEPCSGLDGSPPQGMCADQPGGAAGVIPVTQQVRQGRLQQWLAGFTADNVDLATNSTNGLSRIQYQANDITLARQAYTVLLEALTTLHAGEAVIAYPMWLASTAYAEGDAVQPTVDNGHFYRALNAGTSDGTEPALWDTADGETTDNDIQWQDMGIKPLAAWDDLFADVQAELLQLHDTDKLQLWQANTVYVGRINDTGLIGSNVVSQDIIDYNALIATGAIAIDRVIDSGSNGHEYEAFTDLYSVPARATSTAYSIGDVVTYEMPALFNANTGNPEYVHRYASAKCTTAGTTSAIEPTDELFPISLADVAPGGLFTDGTAVFQFVGRSYPSLGIRYVPGFESDATEPTFETDGTNTIEAKGVQWVDNGTIASANPKSGWLNSANNAQITAFADKYREAADRILSNAQLQLSPKANANTIQEVSPCWQDEGGAWWVYSGEEGFLPAFTNDPYYSVVRGSDGKIRPTYEFYFYIAVSESCAGALKAGDKVTITIKDAQRTYQIGDLFRLPIVYSAPLALTDGQTGDNLNTWKVKGSISGALTDYVVEHGNELDYNLHSLHFTIFRGDIPYLVGDSYEFSVSGGTFKWRKNSDPYTTGVDIAPVVALSDGLLVEFPPAVTPQFAIGDSWQFAVRQPYAVSNMTTPTLDYYDSGVTGVSIILSWASLTQIDWLAIAGHDLSGVTILYSDDGGTTKIPAVVTEGVVISAPISIPIDWVDISSTAGSRIAWLFAGTGFTASVCVEQSIGWANTIDAGERSANWQYGGLDGELNYRIIPNADYLQLKAIFQNAKENGDWPVMYFPNKNIPEESGTCRFTDNRLAVSDFRRFGNPTTTNRRLSTKVTLEHYSFSAD